MSEKDDDVMDRALEDFSAHGGFLEFQGKEDYIRGGAISHTVEVPPTACLRGLHVLGAVPQKGSALGNKMVRQKGRLGFQPHTLATGQKMLKLSPMGTRKALTLASPQNWKAVAKHANTIADHLNNLHSRLLRSAGSRVHGDVVGVTIPTRLGPRRVNVKLPSASEIKSMARQLQRDAKTLNDYADKHSDLIKKTSAAQKPQKKQHVVGSHLLGDGRMLEIAGDAIADELTVNAADLVDESGTSDEYYPELLGQGMPVPDPTNPGYLTDGTPDPAYGPPQDGSQSSPQSQGEWAAVLQQDQSELAQLPGPDQNWGLAPRPTDYASAVAFEKALDPTNMSLEEQAYASGNASSELLWFLQQGHSLDDWYAQLPIFGRWSPGVADPDGGPPADVNFYTTGTGNGVTDPGSMPNGKLVGDTSSAFNGGLIWFDALPPFMTFGSYTQWFGGYPGGRPPIGGMGAGLQLNSDGWYLFQPAGDPNHLGGKTHYSKYADSLNLAQDVPWMIQQGYGPLCARPDSQILWNPSSEEGRTRTPDSHILGDTAGLRFDCGGGGTFWFWDQAPEPRRFALKQVYVKQAQGDWDAAKLAAQAAYNQALATLAQDQKDADAFNREVAKDNSELQHQIDMQNQKNQAAEAAAQSAANQQLPGLQTQEQQQELQLQQQALDLQKQQQDLAYQQQQAETAAYQQWLTSGQWQQDQGGGGLDDGSDFGQDDGSGGGMDFGFGDPAQFEAQLDSQEGPPELSGTFIRGRGETR